MKSKKLQILVVLRLHCDFILRTLLWSVSSEGLASDVMFVRRSVVYRQGTLLCSIRSCMALLLDSAMQVWGWSADSMGLWPVEQLLELILCGGLFLLHEGTVALGDTPAIRLRQGSANWATRGWLQVLPVVTTGSERDKTIRMFTEVCTCWWYMCSIAYLWCLEVSSDLALTQGLVCISKPAPQLPCFSDAAGRIPLSAASSSATALMW